LSQKAAPPTYRALFALPGFPRLVAGMQLARIADSMAGITVILFVLQRYHSPALAGLTEFMAILPGLVVSPVVGALLDRHGRIRLIIIAYVVGGSAYLLIAGLSHLQALSVSLLLTIAFASSFARPFAETGLRSLFPLVVPRHLWERANAVDSNGFVVATVIGPPLAGFIVAFRGGEVALVVISLLTAVAAFILLRVKDPETEVETSGSLLRDAFDGLLYVLRNPALRGLALTVSAYNTGFGIVDVALPVLILQRLHQGPGTVGLMWTVLGLAGTVSVWLWGRYKSEGREGRMIVVASVGGAIGLALIPLAGSLPVIALGMAIVGIANGPYDIALFTLRQRRTAPAWTGRAFAVSMALNFTGVPLGSALAGALIGVSLNAALWVAVAFTLIGATMPLFTIRDRPAGQHRP
jgi:predicted MFS family arabinose efflux permease